MKNVFSFFFSFLFLLFSCHTEKKKEAAAPSVLSFNLTKDPLPNDINAFLAKLDIRLIPLATTEDAYFNGNESNLFVGKEYLFVTDYSQDMLLLYDKQGKLINKIDRKGEGPEEYIRLGGVCISEDKIYILDFTKIQLYDFEGDYLKSIPLKNGGRQLAVLPDRSIAVTGRSQDNYQVTHYNEDGTVRSEYFPRKPDMAGFPLSRATIHSVKSYEDGVYFTNYFDNSIYFLKDTVRIFATCDFGPFNIPSDLFSGTTEEKVKRFDEARPKAVMGINHLTVTDRWIIFVPDILFNPLTVYYDRIHHTYLTNKGFPEPYATLLGKQYAPDNYNAAGDLFYRLVNSQDLKDMIEQLTESDPDYKNKYPFLQSIDPRQINENTNDMVFLMKIKE